MTETPETSETPDTSTPEGAAPAKSASPFRHRLYEIIFEADTPAGRAFDVALLACIILSVGIVMLDSIRAVRTDFGVTLYRLEWFFTILFTVEYVLRLISIRRPVHYAFSFYGIVDLLAILPTYISLFVAGSQYLLVVRALRLLRVFRVFKLAHFLGEASTLRLALIASVRKIIVFIGSVLVIVIIVGSLMYLIEGEENGFTSIPRGMYWAIVTLTTVGYGDISPQTIPGQFLASVVMIMGYGIIAIPTGIVSVELARATPGNVTTRACSNCSREGHAKDAVFCKYCGERLG